MPVIADLPRSLKRMMCDHGGARALGRVLPTRQAIASSLDTQRHAAVALHRVNAPRLQGVWWVGGRGKQAQWVGGLVNTAQ